MMNDGLQQNLLSLPDYALNLEVEDLETRIDDHVNVSLRYACRSWHSHLTKTNGDVSGVVFYLRIFLEEKFLAWLEVVSVIGAVGGAVVALENLMPWLQKVCFWPPLHHHPTIAYHESGCQKRAASIHRQRLLSIRDQFFRGHKCLRSTHLSLRLGTMPHVVNYPKVVSSPEDHSLAKSGSRSSGFMGPNYSHFRKGPYIGLCTWSPCGRFVAAQTRKVVEIRSQLTLELTTILQPPETITDLTGPLAYSPDGRSIACASDIAIIIWDIQYSDGWCSQRNKM